MKKLIPVCMGLMVGVAMAQDGPNPWLANAPWPISHHDSGASDSSPVAGPVTSNQLGAPSYVATSLVNITLATSPQYRQGGYAYWGSSNRSVYKLTTSGGALKKIDEISKPSPTLPGQNPISGAYTLVDVNNVFYTVQGTTLLAYADNNPGDINSSIALKHSFTLPASITGSDDAIVGLYMLWDGNLAFATKNGIVAVVDRAFTTVRHVNLGSGEAISNSIATDSAGSIYVVTAKNMHRVQWTGTSLSRDPASGAWTSAYNTGNSGAGGGRLGAGSGSTPTLMGEGRQQFVVITDGADVANIVLFWKDAIPANWQPIAPGKDRRIAAEVPVNFGDPNRKATASEQSVVVNGYGAVVVSNDYRNLDLISGSTGYDIIDQWQNGIIAMSSGSPLHQPWGVQKFQWNTITRKLESSWVNMSVSCPNAIPTVSSSSNMFYCVGADKGYWTLEGMNWSTGQSVFRKYLGAMPNYNSFYAATEITPEGGIIYGTVSGAIYLPRR